MEKILITGSKSRAASRLSEFFLQNKHSHDFILLEPNRLLFDITNRDAVNTYLIKNKPDWIIHFAAITDVKLCEKVRGSTKSLVWRTNVVGVENLIESCKKFHIKLIYPSTSMVFPGLQEFPGPYNEVDMPEKNLSLLSWYGATKAVAENNIRASEIEYCILRFSSTTRAKFIERKQDFFWKIMQNLLNGTKTSYFSDQYISLTDHAELAEVIRQIICLRKTEQTLHLSSPNITTPFEVARYLATKTGFSIDSAHASTLSSYALDHSEQEVRRFFPKYSGLQSQSSQETLGLRFKTWEKIVEAFVHENNL
ncbi:MAG: NAD(P)-dependent oxidoreductase [Candidatus Pacebacteria bacterium]|nr:NAD(P)-dependent oxidoreductase [Candidatus Paceibacterota bacterium]